MTTVALVEPTDTQERPGSRYKTESVQADTQPRLISVNELAAEWGVCRSHIYTLIHTQVLPYMQIGKRYFVVRSVANRFIDDLSATTSVKRA